MCTVAVICQPEYFRFCYENDLDKLLNVREFLFNFEMKLGEFKELTNYDADVNIFFRGEHFPEEVLSHLSGVKINLSSEPFPRYIDGKLEYTYDSFNRYLDFRKIRYKKFDYIFHYDESSLDFMARDGLHLSGAFPFPVATDTYFRAETEKLWDLFFIGRSSRHREKYFNHLKHTRNFLHIAHGIWGPPLVKYIHESSICLNIHAENEVSWEPRLQMLLASGAFVISEKITPNPILRPNIDYVEIKTPQELHEAVAYYLAHPFERQEIAESGFQRVRHKLNAIVEFSRLIKEIESGQIVKFTVGRELKLLNIFQSIKNKARYLRNLLN